MVEEEIMAALSAQNEEYRVLSTEHKELKDKLNKMNTKVYLTPEEELEKKTLQKLKLQKKDRMAEMLREFKETQSVN